MRTTVDLPDDIHQRAVALARDSGRSLSSTLAALVEAALTTDPAGGVEVDDLTGLPLVRYGRIVTSAEVSAALDE
ncbi:MAG: antitoxin [Actinomycetota bacterium]